VGPRGVLADERRYDVPVTVIACEFTSEQMRQWLAKGHPYFAELAKAMTAVAGQRGYQLVLCVTENDAEATARYLDAMQAMYAPFAVIAPYARVFPAEFESRGFAGRLVVIDRVESGDQTPTVTVDSATGIALALDHLFELGHTSIAYVSGIAGTHTSADRRQAYRTLAEKHPWLPAAGLEAVEQSRRGDFTTRPASHHLWSSGGEGPADFLEEAALLERDVGLEHHPRL